MTRKQLRSKILALVRHHGIHWPVTESETSIRRIRAGHHQRSAGAWSWELYTKEHVRCGRVGSQFAATEIARLGPLRTEVYSNRFGDDDIIPSKGQYGEASHAQR
jgi:hypothetical protein